MLESLKPYLTVRNAIYFFSFIAGWPCVFYLLGWLPNYQINYIVLFGICFIFTILIGGEAIPSKMRNILYVQIFCWVFYSMIHQDTSYFTRILYLLITYMLLKMQYNDDNENNFVKIYDGWISLQAVCGTIGLILVTIGILTPLGFFTEMDGRRGYFFGLFTTNVYFGGLVRNAGFFDEPGAMACWGIYALLLNKLFVKNKVIEYALIIGLISTLSMAYYIQLAGYLLLFYRKRTWKLILIVVTIYMASRVIASYNTELSNAIFGRFEYNESTGKLAGDNRSDLVDTCWKIFCDYPIFGMGARALASSETAQTYGFVGANFFTGWAADGLIGAFVSYLPLIMIFQMGRFDKKYYGVGLILLIGFLQRPYDSAQLLFPLLTYSILLHGYMSESSIEDEDNLLESAPDNVSL